MGIALAIMFIVFMIGLSCYIYISICQGLMLKKAGQPMWIGFVPWYGDYKVWELADASQLFFINLGISILYNIVVWTCDGALLMALASPILVSLIVIKSIFCGRIARAFGFDTVFGVGVFFLPYIFYGILAFSGCKHCTTEQFLTITVKDDGSGKSEDSE